MSDDEIQPYPGTSGDYPILQEYPLQSSLLQLIPAQAQKGLSTFDIEFTCVDTDGHYIAIGSNIGIVYLFDRRKNQLFRLRNDHKDAITCVKVLISLDCMVVFGCKNGAVFVFKVSLSGEEELEKFTVDGLHSTRVTALEWDKNGMKFFSGDETGVVVCTEIDYFEHQSRSRIFLNEQSKIVQLSCDRKYLLISTLLRSVICSFEDDNSVTKIGQKERKCFGSFGALICNSNNQDAVVYASRPGQRLWKSDKSGVIHETIIFKTALSETHPIIPLNVVKPKRCDFTDFQFEKLLLFSEKCILISSDCAFVLIAPEQKSVVSSSPKLFPVVDVTTSNEEVFVLRGTRQLIRISSYPDPYACEKMPEEPSLIEDILVPFKEFGTYVKERTDTFSAQAESSTIFDWLRKKRSTSSPAMLPTPVSEEIEAESTDSKSLPELVKLDTTDCTPVSMDSSMISIDSIPSIEINITGDNESDDIVYKPKKKKKKRVRFRSGSPQGTKSPDSISPIKSDDADSVSITSNTNEESSDKKETSVPSEILVPNLEETSSEAISKEISPGDDSVDNPELDSSKIIDSVDSSTVDTPESDLSKIKDSVDNSVVDSNANSMEENTPPSINVTDSQEPNNNINLNNESTINQKNPTSVDQHDDEDDDFDDIYLSLDPSQNTTDTKPVAPSDHVDDCNEESSSTTSETNEIVPLKYGVYWVEYKTPEALLDICISNDHVFCVDIKNQLYFSNYPILGLQWRDLSQPAEKIAVSPSESVVWALYRGVVYVAMQKHAIRWFDTEWFAIARDVVSMAVDDDCGWYVTQSGELFVRPNLSPSSPYGYPESVSCNQHIIQVACRNKVVWVLAEGGSLFSLETKKSETVLSSIRLNQIPDIHRVFLGIHQTGWIIDNSGKIWLLIGVTPRSPGGVGNPWEVEASNYVVEQNTLQKVIRETMTGFIKSKQHMCLSTSTFGVWFCKTTDHFIYANQKNVIGHMWDPFIPLASAFSTKWSFISAGSVLDSQGSLWCLNSTGELFCVSTITKTPVTVELPSVHNICCLAPSGNALWILTEVGEIFYRKGISPNYPEGVRWIPLNLTQLREEQITSISCSTDASWACTSKGNVYMRIGTLCPAASRSLPQAWIPINSPSCEDIFSPLIGKLSAMGMKIPMKSSFPLFYQPSSQVVIHKVYVGPLGYPVWAIDNRFNVYVREGTSPRLPVGQKWTFVPTLHAKELGISRNAVWLLKRSGKIYRRFNVTEKNPCGDYWKQIPGMMDHLSVTPDDDIWGLKDNSIYTHSSFLLKFPNDPTKSQPMRSISEDDDWEDIMADVDDEL